MNALILSLALLGAVPDLEQLVTVRENIEKLDALTVQGVVSDKDGAIRESLLAKAKELSGGKVDSYESLVELTGGDHRAASATSKLTGYFTFVNIILVTSVILVVGALTALFGAYFMELILMLPASIWHVLLWGLCGFLTFSSIRFAGDMYLAMALPGCLGMIGCCSLGHYLYFGGRAYHNGEIGEPHTFDSVRFFAFVLAVAWAVSAIYLGSHVIGFMAVMAAMTALGFVMGVFPGIVVIGFQRDNVIVRSTLSAGVMLALHVALIATGNTMQSLEVFREGMAFMGSFVCYLGLLILSSRYMCFDTSYRTNWRMYLIMQVITIAAGLAALYFGTVLSIPLLLGVGGTLFYLYLIEKYYEIPWSGIGWVWSTLGLGGILYAFAIFAQSHPEYFFMK